MHTMDKEEPYTPVHKWKLMVSRWMTRPSKLEEHKLLQLTIVLPLDINDGLPYLPLRLPSTRERQTLPQIVLTADTDWDPRVLDLKISDSSEWKTLLENSIPTIQNNPFDEFGDYCHVEVKNHFTQVFLNNLKESNNLDDVIDHCVMHTLVENQREEHEDLLQVATLIETIDEEDDLDRSEGFLRAEFHDIDDEEELVEEATKKSKFIDEPNIEAPLARGHLPLPP